MVDTQSSRVWWVHRGAGYGGYTEEQGMVGTCTQEQGMVGTQRGRVWWVHRGAGYGEYTEEQGMVDTQRSRVWCVHRGARYGGHTEEQGIWWVHKQPRTSSDIHVLAITQCITFIQCTNLIPGTLHMQFSYTYPVDMYIT